MQKFFHHFGVFACLLLAFFLVISPVQAQEDAGPTSAPIGRYCPATVSIIGISEDTVAFLAAEEQAGRMQARAQAQYIVDHPEGWCTLENITSGKGKYTLNLVYPFDVQIDPIDIYNKFQTISKGDAQKAIQEGQNRAAFFEGGRFKELSQDGSVFICQPLPKNVFNEYTAITGNRFVNLGKIGYTDDSVTLDTCPEFNGQFAFTTEATYLTRISVRTGPLAYQRDLQGNGGGSGKSNIANQLNLLKVDSVPALIGALIKILMGVLGTISLVVVIYGGILWMTAAGNANREKEGMEIVFWAVLGVIIILSSYALVNFIITNAF